MSNLLSRRSIAAGLLLLTGCGSDLLSPVRADRSSAAARSSAVALSAGPVSASAISLSWNDGVRNEAGWEVHRSDAGVAGPFSLLATLSANNTGHHDAGLGAQTQYCYKVRSFRMRGPTLAPADFSDVACATTFSAPAAPSALSAVPLTSSSIQVSWVDNASNETGIRVERAPAEGGPWTVAATLATNSTSWADHSRAADQPACYRAVAVGNHGDGVSDPDCTVPPARPENIAASTTGTSTIDVSWTDASLAEDGYEIQRSTNGFPFSFLETLPAGSSSYTDASVVSDQRYLYRVRATRDGGFSTFSDIAAGFTVTGPPTPAAINAYVGSSSVVWVRTGMSPTTTGLRIERSSDGATGWAQIANLVVNGGDGANDYLDDGRAAEARVCYRVFASNSFGEAAASNVDCTIPLAAPTDISVVWNDDGSQTTSWTDNSNNEEFYLLSIYYCYDYCEYYYDVWLEANSTSYITWPYEYAGAVYACGDGGCSDAGSWLGSSSAVTAGNAGALRASDPLNTAANPMARATLLRERITKARRPIPR